MAVLDLSVVYVRRLSSDRKTPNKVEWVTSFVHCMFWFENCRTHIMRACLSEDLSARQKRFQRFHCDVDKY